MQNADFIRKGSRRYLSANLALFFAGFVTFTTLYDFQPLFPNLVSEYGISPATASLALSCATFSLAWTLPLSGTLSDAVGRRLLMALAVILAPLLTFATAAVESLTLLLLLRLVLGVVLAGVPAVAMAYLNEEIEPRSVGSAMGLYIAGNAFGGMTGRIATAWLADFLPWRLAIDAIAVTSLILGVLFLVLIPPSRNFRRQPFHPRQLTASLLRHLAHPGLQALYLVAFSTMGGFVTLYNYVTFRLLGPDYALDQTQVGLIFLAYAFGAFGSSLMGTLSQRVGRSRILITSLGIMAFGLALTLFAALPAVIAGIVIFTVGFFGAHAVASAWVGLLAEQARGQASSLYLFAYYLGSSVSGTAGGFLYSHFGWGGVAMLVALMIGLAATAWLRLLALRGGSRQAEALEVLPGGLTSAES